jgi:hypothetical protein
MNYEEFSDMWENVEYAVLIKKKANGHPRNRKIGERLKIVGLRYNSKCPRIRLKGSLGRGDFNLHIDYLLPIHYFRGEVIDHILKEEIIDHIHD